ncbi:MAG: cytochrome c [Betaproteobacteria bacterium]|nr:cytochrome c [Betaproteobacteria bacterium]
MRKRVMLTVVALALGAGASFQVSAQVSPETLVKQRQAAMALQGKYFGPIGAMVQGKTPWDAAIITRNAGYLETLTKMPWDGFQASTADLKSDAKPEIYKEAEKFRSASQKLEAEVGKLAAAAKSGDQNAVKAAFGETGKACKGCHDDYRVKR